MGKILEIYPFVYYPENPIEIVEGFSSYVGNLGDTPGDPHKGIDYVRKSSPGRFLDFMVFAAHSGWAVWGKEESFGNFVMIWDKIEKIFFYLTVYAHLDTISSTLIKDLRIPKFKPQKRNFWPEGPFEGSWIPTGIYLGTSGTTGWTNNIPQLHFELHEFKMVSEKWVRRKIDPYGIYDDINSGKYPQPNQSLSSCPNHFWTSDNPPFA